MYRLLGLLNVRRVQAIFKKVSLVQVESEVLILCGVAKFLRYRYVFTLLKPDLEFLSPPLLIETPVSQTFREVKKLLYM